MKSMLRGVGVWGATALVGCLIYLAIWMTGGL